MIVGGQKTQIYESRKLLKKNLWRHNFIHSDNVKGAVLARGNDAGTPFGRLRAGTLMGGLSSGLVRPIAVAKLVADAVALVAIVENAANFYEGDLLSCFEPEWAADVGAFEVVSVNHVLNELSLVQVGGLGGILIKDAILRTQDGYALQGVLEDEVDTRSFDQSAEAGEVVAHDRVVSLAIEGNIIVERMVGLTDPLGEPMAGGNYVWETSRRANVAGFQAFNL